MYFLQNDADRLALPREDFLYKVRIFFVREELFKKKHTHNENTLYALIACINSCKDINSCKTVYHTYTYLILTEHYS